MTATEAQVAAAMEALDCERDVDPNRNAYCKAHWVAWLSDVNACPRAERTANAVVAAGPNPAKVAADALREAAPDERRAPVQNEDPACRRGSKPRGSVAWAEHVEAWNDYHRHHSGQSAERIAERGGFGYWEITDHLGHEPTTWKATP